MRPRKSLAHSHLLYKPWEGKRYMTMFKHAGMDPAQAYGTSEAVAERRQMLAAAETATNRSPFASIHLVADRVFATHRHSSKII